MTFSELMDKLRLKLDDVVEPQLWTDPELFDYLLRACEMFVSTVYGNNITYTIDVSEGDYQFDLSSAPDYLLYPVRAVFGGEKLYENENVTYSDSPTGFPLYYKWDEPNFYIYPASDRAEELSIVFQASINSDTITSNLEVPLNKEHQLSLLEGAMSFAYGKRDSEAYDEKLAERYFQFFSISMEQAKRDVMRVRRPIRGRIFSKGFF